MAATEQSYALAEQFRLQQLAIAEAVAVYALGTFTDAFVPGIPGSAEVFAVLAAAAVGKGIAMAVRSADRFVADFLSIDLGTPALALGLDPARYMQTGRVTAALQVAATKTAATAPATPTPAPASLPAPFDDRPARLSIEKVTRSEILQAGRIATRDAMSPAQYFAQAAQAARAERAARGLPPGRRPPSPSRRSPQRPDRVIGWRRLTGPTPCDVCRGLATDEVHPPSVVLLPGHPRCSCVGLPVTSAGDVLRPPTGDQLPPEEINR